MFLLVSERQTGAQVDVPQVPPYVVEFDLYHEAYFFDDPREIPSGVDSTDAGSVLVTDQYRWEFRDWNSWSFTKLCCEDPLDPSLPSFGWTREALPDGTYRYRQQADSEWDTRPAPEDGSTPLPDVSPRWKTQHQHDVPVSIEVLDGWRRVLAAIGVSTDDVTVFQRGSTVVAVFEPLGLPVISVEYNSDGELIRRLEVTSLRALGG